MRNYKGTVQTTMCMGLFNQYINCASSILFRMFHLLRLDPVLMFVNWQVFSKLSIISAKLFSRGITTRTTRATHHLPASILPTPLSLSISRIEKFSQILDKLHPTATGLDSLPAWFLRLGAPAFCKPVAQLFNLSLTTSTFPQQ